MKNKPKQSRIFVGAMAIVLMTSFLSAGNGYGFPSSAPQDPTAPFQAFLPYVFRQTQQQQVPVGPIFGVESAWIDPNLLTKAQGVDASWWRYFSFSWKDIEPNDVSPGQYSWTSVKEQHLTDASSHGFSIVATVKYVPYWAQAINDPNSIKCSPIKDDAATIADFVEFITTVVTRYSQPPFNIKYWQFWNEPDVSPQVLGTSLYSSPFGCWGVESDNYYGGEKYGKFLSIFAQTVKATDPQAKTTNGGMLLDCNPNENPTCVHGKFFEGTLRGLQANNGLSYLDYVSFHVYGQWYGNLYYDEAWPGFLDGGVLLGKSKFLRQVMRDYGIDPPKPLIMTEAGLMCRRSDTNPLPSGVKCSDTQAPPEFEDDQAEYVVWIYVRSIADGISGVMWYMLNYQAYRHVGLMYPNGSSKPGYIAYQFLVSQIGGAQYNGTLSQYFPTLRAYEFTKGSQRVWIIWAPDQVDHNINLPVGFQTAFDKLGNVISLAPGATTITINGPVYLILN